MTPTTRFEQLAGVLIPLRDSLRHEIPALDLDNTIEAVAVVKVINQLLEQLDTEKSLMLARRKLMEDTPA